MLIFITMCSLKFITVLSIALGVKNYFVVYGEPNTEFSWELKAKRKGYEECRLEQPNKFGEADIINLDRELLRDNTEQQKINEELITIYGDELTYDLSNKLLEV